MRSEERLQNLVERIGSRDGLRFWRAPGRVNLIGEHIDYLGGRVLPFACDREVLLATVPNPGEIVLSSLEEPEPAVVPIDGEPELAGWTRYVGGVVAALREAGLGVRGVRGALSSTIPMGAGLSSSAALEAAVALAVTDARPVPPEVLREAEYRATGVPCGVMDQAAVLGAGRGTPSSSTAGRARSRRSGSPSPSASSWWTRGRVADSPTDATPSASGKSSGPSRSPAGEPGRNGSTISGRRMPTRSASPAVDASGMP